MIYGPNLDNSVRRIIARVTLGLALCVSLCVTLIQGADNLYAEDPVSTGSSSKRLKSQTIQSLPYHLLNQATQNKIKTILEKPSVYRRLPVTSIKADPDYFRFLTRYPEVIVSIWQLMGITNMTTERTGPYSIATNDGAGTISNLELIYGDQNLHIFYGEGTYEGPILKRKLAGKCVLVLKTEGRNEANGSPVTTSQLDVFLKIENATVGMMAKTISPLVGSTADHNFVQSLKFVQRLNETTEKNGPGVQQMGKRLKMSPDVRQKFNEAVNLVFQRAVNASVPEGDGMPVAPASMETRYTTPSQSPRPLNGSVMPPQNYPSQPRPAPAFENLRDSGYNSQYPRLQYPVASASHTSVDLQSRYVSPLPFQTEQVHRLPARGHQPPGSNAQAAWASEHVVRPESGPRVRPAGIDDYQPRPSVIQANGWRPR